LNRTRPKFGALTKAIFDGASWIGEDDFPSNQTWADEVEKILKFLESQGQFENYLPILRGKITQRDGALAEARVAFFFHRNEFKILAWHPPGASSRLYEFEVQWRSSPSIFVEVKGPRWEGELSEEELNGPRRQQPRYINGEARFYDSIGKMIEAANKAIPKFLPDKPNLLVVVGYLLFVSPRELPQGVVEPRIRHELSDDRFSKLGGLVIFDFDYGEKAINYQAAFIENPRANDLCKIPFTVAKGLLMANKKVFRCQ